MLFIIWKMRGWRPWIPLLVLSEEVIFLTLLERRVNLNQEEIIHDRKCSSIWFRHPPVTCGLYTRSDHWEQRRAFVSNNELSIQEHGTCRELVRPKRAGKYLYPLDE